MSEIKVNPSVPGVGAPAIDNQTIPEKTDEKVVQDKVAEKPGVEIIGGDNDGSAAAAKSATELAGTKQASATGSVLGQITHRIGEGKQYLLVGVNDDARWLDTEKEEAIKAICERHGVELLREGGNIFGSNRTIEVDASSAQKVAKEVNALDGIFAVRGSKLVDAPAMKGRAPAVDEWAAKLTDGPLPERIGAARRLLKELRKGSVGKDETARNAIGDAIYALLGPTVSLFNNVHQSLDYGLRKQIHEQNPDIDHNEIFLQASTILRDPKNRTAFEPARQLAIELFEVLDRLGTPRTQAFLLDTLRHADYALYEYMRDNPASAKKLVNRWLKEAGGRLKGLERYMSLSEEKRRADEDWRQPSHSGGYENLPNLSRSATEAYKWTPDFPVIDFPTDPGLLLDSKVADHLIAGIEKLALQVDKALPALAQKAFDHEVQKEYEGMVRMVERANREITPELKTRLRQEATEQIESRNYSSSRVDGLESLDRILGMIPYHARNSWSCPVSQDAVMSKAIDLHVSLLDKVQSEGMGREVINNALALLGFAQHLGDDMKLSDATRAKLPGLAQAIINFEHDPKAVSMAAYSMGKGKMPEALPLLKAGLASDDPDVRKTSVESIREFGEGAVAPIHLMPLLEDENSHWIQADAAFTLLVVAPEQVEAAKITLRSLLEQEGSHRYWVNGSQHSSQRRDAQRTSVIENLGKLGDAAIPAAPVLTELLDDPDSDYVRMAASCTLMKLGVHTEEALRTITDLTSAGGTIKWVGDDPERSFSSNAVAQSKEKDAGFRNQVIQQLNYLGAKAEAALPLLRTLAGDADESVAEMANRAIKAIETKLG